MAENMTLASNKDFNSYIQLLHLMEFFHQKE